MTLRAFLISRFLFAACSSLLVFLAATSARGQGFFSRGDSDGSGGFIITDAVNTLGFLFLGNPDELLCKDAADTNDDGQVTLTDAIYGLNFLFLGNDPPPPPYPDCGPDGTPGDRLGCDSFPPCPLVSLRSSKSSTIAISTDERWVAMVNPEDDSLSILDTSTNMISARVPTGDEPSSVVIHPDSRTAFVSNRAAANVVKVTGIDTASPSVLVAVEVGSEPTGLALSPSGAKLFVAEFAEGRVSVFDTGTMMPVGVIENPVHPRALAVTNDGDADDDDELLVVPEFFGEPVAGGEGSDTGRTGRVRIYSVSDLAPTPPILLAPVDSGFAPDGSAEGTPAVMASPNQLYSVAIEGGKIYVASISASPAPPVKFNTNVEPVVYAGDLASRAEDRSNAGTTNLARKVADALSEGTPRFFLADLADLDFVPGTGVAYVVSRGADVLQRVRYDGATGVTLGTAQAVQIDLASQGAQDTCRNPTGVAVNRGGTRAYVNCWISRSVAVVDLSSQSVITTVGASPLPAPESLAGMVQSGRRFFFTGRGRWSHNAWSSCGSCHPDGLTDNITWIFAAGPRQTTSLDGSFSKLDPNVQRIFNWTGIFDEMHDFERNTRGVSGGLGAITTSPSGACGTLAEEVEDPAVLPANLAQPLKELQDRPENCTGDWDDIERFVQTIRPPRGLRFLDFASVMRGRVLFSDTGACVRCHSGQIWTLSQRFWFPATATNMMLAATQFVRPALWPPSWNVHTLQIAAQPDAADPAAGTAIGPAQVACVIRNLGTFGVPGDAAATEALERKDSGQRAQGAGGYNIPSLFGLSLGAPYLHHGQAGTLDELFSDPKWEEHLRAGNPNFLLTGDIAEQRADLINFLLSIDEGAPAESIPAGWDGCGGF